MDEERAPEDTSRLNGPLARALEKYNELKMFAELAAIFEGTRKFEAEIVPGLDLERARDIQKHVARLDKQRIGETGVLQPAANEQAIALLTLCDQMSLSTNDYHVQRRPGEVMIVRWIAGEQVESFYERLQAHLDAGLGAFVSDERSNNWKKDKSVDEYLDALEKVASARMEDRWRRAAAREAGICVLSTQTADEMNIAFLADQIMGASADALVGTNNAPPADPAEADLAWFFKLFMLRGTAANQERMCFFTYLQKTQDTFDLDA